MAIGRYHRALHACAGRAKNGPMPAAAHDPHDLQRFVAAQEGVHARALEELRRGSKRSHWMWFVFPQLDGLGRSEMARRYAIRSREEAAAYLRHEVLGPRLRECADALMGVEGKTAHDIMGFPDDLKLQSSMTLFAHISDLGSVFHRVLDKFFRGQQDAETLKLLVAGK